MQDYFSVSKVIGWAFPCCFVCAMRGISGGLICLLLTNDSQQLLEITCFKHFPYISLSSSYLYHMVSFKSATGIAQHFGV